LHIIGFMSSGMSLASIIFQTFLSSLLLIP
jgi:hypothetical protein